MLDLDGVVTDVNAALARLGPATRDDVVGRHFEAFSVPEERARNREHFARVIAGEAVSYETLVRSEHERPLAVAISAAPLYAGPAVTGAFAIVRDVTHERDAARRIREQARDLVESARRLRSLFSDFPDGAVSISTDGIITDANEAVVRLGGFPREAIVGRHFEFWISPEERPLMDARFSLALAGETSSFDLTSFRLDGTPLELHATLIPQRESEEVVGVFSIIQDVTERRAAERRARDAARRLRDLYEIAAGSDYSHARVEATLQLGCAAFGMEAGAVVELGARPTIEHRFPTAATAAVSDRLLDIAARTAAWADIYSAAGGIGKRILVNGETYGALVFVGDPGATRTFEPTDFDLLGLSATLLGSSLERRRQRAHLRELAYTDGLTGLPNRTAVQDRLREAIEVAQSRMERVAVLALDLDRFKDVNETLGHGRGDRLLKLVAERLKGEMWERSTVARMGGDEFVLVVPDCGELENVRDIADRVLAILAEPFALDEYEQYVSASIGIAIHPEHGADEQTLLKNADIAMYRAKDRGRDGAFVYNPALEAPIHMRLSQERLLRKALDLGEFVVYYQPQIDVAHGTLVSVEALVRWNHPKSGLIEPGHFIPSAEISGLIVSLGDWVLETAAKRVRAWQDAYGPLRLAVNLSPKQFHRRDLREHLLGTVAGAGLDPHSLELEITETAAMSDADVTVGIVRELKRSGVRIALDDFGTGYSSLGYLRRFDIDVLKIDRSFTSGIGVQPSDETIVRTVLAMAHNLGLEVVAEGVETEAQLAFLRRYECDLVQGFVVAPALPPEEMEALLRERRGAARPTG